MSHDWVCDVGHMRHAQSPPTERIGLSSDMDILKALDNHRGKHYLLVWLTTAPELRDPPTLEELAGSEIPDADGQRMPSSRSLRSWKWEDTFLKLWRAHSNDVVGSPERTQRVLEALEKTALDGEHKQHVAAANSFLKAVGAMTPPEASAVVKEKGLEQYTVEELQEMAANVAKKELQERGVPMEELVNSGGS